MKDVITTLIPRYGELNRIYKDWSDNKGFSFEKQKFIVDFYSEWSDIKAFEQAILELVLHTPPEPCTLLLKSLKKEVREYTRLYEAYSLPHDEVIMRVCNQYADSYKEAIKEEMEVVNRLRKPMNEANNRYDTIGYREHTPEEKSWRKENMSVARLNMKGRKPSWTIFMSSKPFSGKKPGNT